MHFNIYVDDEIGQQLKFLAEKKGETRNALIRRVLREWVQKKNSDSQWPALVRDFQGIAEIPPFEAARHALQPPAADPLA